MRHRVALRADRQRVARVLHVHGREDPVPGEQRGAHVEAAVRARTPLGRILARGGDELVDACRGVDRASWRRPPPVPRRFVDRGARDQHGGDPPPLTFSAWRFSPRNATSSPFVGILPSRSSISPATVSHSSSGQLGAEHLVHVVDRGLPGDAVDAVAELQHLGLLRGRTRRRSRRPAPRAGPRATTIPVTEPCSSETSAWWNFSRCISLQQLGDPLRLGDEVRRPHDLRRAACRPCPGAAPSARPSRTRRPSRRRGRRGRRGSASTRARAPAPGRRGASRRPRPRRCRGAAPSPRARSCRRTRRSSGSAPSRPPRSSPPREPTSAIERISSSETNGPCFSPLPGQEHVREADQEARRDREDAAEEPHERRERERDPVACAGPRTSSPSPRRTTKYSSVNTNEASVTQVLPNSRSARSATRIADPFCTNITER